MVHRVAILVLLASAAAPRATVAQGFGIGGRLGSLGLGGEVALALSESIVGRAGIGFFPFDAPVTLSGLDVDLSLPSVWNVGVDVYLNGAFRLGAGWFFKSRDAELRGTFTEPQDIGGTEFTPEQLGTLTGVLDTRNHAPYLLIGFGKHTASGSGLFIDFGVAFTGEPGVRLSTRGGTLSPDEEPLRSALARQAADTERELPGYLKVWPILSLGFRLGSY